MLKNDLLIEIGTEELPPKALKSLSTAFTSGIIDQLEKEAISFESYKSFATPRRLGLIVRALADSQADKKIEKFGPALKASFDASGNPTPAALGFAKSCNTQVNMLLHAEKDGVTKLVFRADEKGANTVSLIPAIVETSLDKLPIPKKMRWGSSRVEFVRPVHWVVLMYGNEAISANILGKSSGSKTFGHRFHYPNGIMLDNPDSYEESLSNTGYVIVDFELRKEKVRTLVQEQAAKLGALVVIDESLLDEVTSLVEWPVALSGTFNPEFLSVPAEALISSMMAHQKCFYLTDQNGKLLPNFIAVSNLESKDPIQVIVGNEKVIRPRLADAEFFYRTDSKQTLESRLEQLKSIVFQQQLGSVFEKTLRVKALAKSIAQCVGGEIALCERAALLSKCDLVTNMVGEFADLQGTMGKYYALLDGEELDVASALHEHYMPRFSGDVLPSTLTGSILAIADKLDTIAGMFSIGQPPTGSKDPFGLRRAAIGILRILIEKNLDLDLFFAIDFAHSNLTNSSGSKSISADTAEFLMERFKNWYLDEGIPPEVIQSVMSLNLPSPFDFHYRVTAITRFNKLPEAKSLASANKRVANILSKLEFGHENFAFDDSLLSEPAEISLAKTLLQKEIDVMPLFSSRSYYEGLEELVDIKKDVDTFFEEVLVMAEDELVKQNRIALLARLRNLFLCVADISVLHQS